MTNNTKVRILITGASGFIGTNLIQSFLNKDYEVINLDNCSPLNTKHSSIWRKVDINNLDEFSKEVLNFNPDYIIHLAARTDLNGKILADYSANTKGVENLMEIIKGLPLLKKIIITSSMLVCHGGYYPKNQFDYAPTTIYGESKVVTEKAVWNNKPKCDWAIIRPTSIWGPWFGTPYRDFFDMVISRKYFHIGNRGCSKTYGYVGNTIYQIERLLFENTMDEKNKVFNIGDSPVTSIEQWGNEIADELNIKIIKMPFFIIKIAAITGDILKLLRIRFPMTSFRLKNMTTDNILDLINTYKIAPTPPYSRIEGVKITLDWLETHKK